jgi:uncharacterized protein involved in exopolysaccharide biosynthesis
MQPPDPSVLSLLELALRRRVLFARISALLFVMVVGVGLLLPRSYTTTASFVPTSTSNGLSRIAGYAAQLGLSLPASGDAGQSSDFYVELLRSPQILRALVGASYTVVDQADTLQGTLVDLYAIREDTPERSRETAVRRLGENMTLSASLRTGVVTLRARSRYPALALQISRRALGLVDEFNVGTRQSEAGAERRFAETRLAESRDSLRTTEDRLQVFLQKNRDFSNSPQLSFQHDRLQRAVDLQQQVVTSLAQSYEQARIEEVRNTPAITMVEQPIMPVRPDSRRLLFKGLFAVMIGVLGVGLWVAGEELLGSQRTREPRLAERLAAEWRSVRTDVRRPWRLFRRDPGDVS